MTNPRAADHDPKPYILVVEDESDLRSLVEYNLSGAGYDTDGVGSGREAQRAIERRVPDLVVLDLMLPDLPGTELCRELRRDERTRGTRVLMLTAKAEEANRVYGFEVGADDYVVKPCSMRELVLRVAALLRRGGQGTGADEPELPNAADPVEIDRAAHVVTVGGSAVELTPLEFRLLELFIDRAGRVQTREMLLDEIWAGEEGVSQRTVDMRVKRLRSRLGSAGERIETVRGIGYRYRREAQG